MNNEKEHETIHNLTGANNYLLDFRLEMIDLPQEYDSTMGLKYKVSKNDLILDEQFSTLTTKTILPIK